jgi:hypothetical protein
MVAAFWLLISLVGILIVPFFLWPGQTYVACGIDASLLVVFVLFGAWMIKWANLFYKDVFIPQGVLRVANTILNLARQILVMVVACVCIWFIMVLIQPQPWMTIFCITILAMLALIAISVRQIFKIGT